ITSTRPSGLPHLVGLSGPTNLRLNRMDLPCSHASLWLHAGGKNPGSIPERSPMTLPGILPSPLRDKVGYSNHDRFRGHIPVHCCSGLQTPCLRFAMAVTGHHARLGTRLLAKLYRGRHFRRLGYMRFQGATRTDPDKPDSSIRLLTTD